MNKRDGVGQLSRDTQSKDDRRAPASSKTRSSQIGVDNQRLNARPASSRGGANQTSTETQTQPDCPSPPKTDLDEPAISALAPMTELPAQSNFTTDEGDQRADDTHPGCAAPSTSNGGDGQLKLDAQHCDAESATNNAATLRLDTQRH